MAEKVFSWTEEETALLLKVALEYKTAKLAEGKDWQTIRAKYKDLAAAFASTYSAEEGKREGLSRSINAKN